ncbi:MAG TPA: tetratricopeptide repeat protein, partial [Euzebyales bacterium]|nr:tetratricopeptide repeat protein [Euzebyales bacterium]
LRAALESVRVMLVLIGPRWLVPDPDTPAHLPIHDDEDWVRLEIRRALERSVRVVPILFDGARLPAPTTLPEDVRRLVHCQAVHVSHLRLGEDVVRLVEHLAAHLPPHARARAPRAPVPRQLPPAPPWFVGRRRELDLLSEEIDTGAQATAMIVGAGGIGKTWLALHWAYRHLDRFPDGQLFVDLRGSSPAGRPMSPPKALRCLLDGLGVDHRSIPLDVDAQIGRYRSLVASRRMLIVLDNAESESQLAALLPGSSTCTVLITSRNRLDGLSASVAARRLFLAPLTDFEARELFLRRFGRSRVAAESDAVAELIGYCAGLPLALGIVAGRIADEDHLPLAASAAELRDAATRVGTLDTGDPTTSVTAVLSWSYHALSTRDARVFALLGLAPTGIGLRAVASLTALPVTDVRVAMRALERLSLVQRQQPERWQMHSLIRLYAASRAEETLLESDRLAATRRVVDSYLHTARAANRLLDLRETVTRSPPVAGVAPDTVEDRAAATRWFTVEHSRLRDAIKIAERHGWHRQVWQFAWMLHSFQWQQGHVRAQAATWQAALTAAQAMADPAALAIAHRQFGSAVGRTGRLAEATHHLNRALELTTELGDLRNLARAHRALARVFEQLGDHERSLDHAVAARRYYQRLGLRGSLANALNLTCWCLTKLGRYEEATVHAAAAIALYRELGDPDGEATTLDSLGHIAHRREQYPRARGYYRRALTLFSNMNAFNEADTLSRLGEVCLRLAMTGEARDAWTRCLSLSEKQERTAEAGLTRRRLADLLAEPTDGGPT